MNEVETLLFSEILQLLVQKGNIKLVNKVLKSQTNNLIYPNKH